MAGFNFFKGVDLLQFNESDFKFGQVVWKTLEFDSPSDDCFMFIGSSCPQP